MSLPLAGRRILVTRAAHQAGKLSEELRALGAIPVEVPILEIRPPASYDPLDEALHRLNQYDWLIHTSATAARALAERAEQHGIALDANALLSVAAVGPATAAAAERAHLRVTLMPEAYVAEGLVSAFAEKALGKRILLARASVARDIIPDALRAVGATIDVVDAYQNVLPGAAPQRLRSALTQPIDAATFTSSSTVTHLAEAALKAGITFPLEGVPAISIGPITSQTLRDLHWEPAAEAQQHDIPGLIEATLRFLNGS